MGRTSRITTVSPTAIPESSLCAGYLRVCRIDFLYTGWRLTVVVSTMMVFVIFVDTTVPVIIFPRCGDWFC